LSGSETDAVEDASEGHGCPAGSFIFGQRIDWDSPLRETMLYVELPFWLMMAPGPVEIEWSGAPFTVHICPMWIEVFAGEVTDSRRSQVFQGPWEPDFSLSEKLEAEIEEAGASWLMRGCKTVLRILARGHEDAFIDPDEGAPPAAWSEHETYWASLCEAHIPVINELIQRYRLATYDFFAYEVSPWDVAVWYLKHNEEGFRTVLLPYKTWDVKPLTSEFVEEGEPPKVEPFEFAEAADLEAISSSTASAGEFDLLDARSLMERGDYSGAVRRTVTAIEAILESVLLVELGKKYGEPEAAEWLKKTATDFPGRVRQWLKLAKPAIEQERFDKFEETRTLRHEIVHRGRRLTQAERHLAQRLVDTGRWLYNEIESKPARKALREFSKHSVLRSVGRSALTVRFPSRLDAEGITLAPLSLPNAPDLPGPV
jgi:hypothetical protein